MNNICKREAWMPQGLESSAAGVPDGQQRSLHEQVISHFLTSMANSKDVSAACQGAIARLLDGNVSATRGALVEGVQAALQEADDAAK
jgi:hypothetical protein